MNKLFAFAAAAFVSATVLAAEPFALPEQERPTELQSEDSPAWIEAGLDLDFLSAYVYRSTIYNDQPVFQPCVWLDLVRFSDYVTLGGYVWQNWNLTSKQMDEGIPNAMNETDFNLHLASTLWTSEDEEYKFNLEFGNEWFTYRYELDTEYMLYLKLDFENPFVTPYGRYIQYLSPESACCFELGLNREWKVSEIFDSENEILSHLKVGLDWSILLGSGNYFSHFGYGMLPQNYDYEAGEYLDEDYMDNGVGGTTIKGNLAYEFCENFSVGLVLAFTSTLSRDAREYMDQIGGDTPSTYKDLVWGGIQAKLSF